MPQLGGRGIEYWGSVIEWRGSGMDSGGRIPGRGGRVPEVGYSISLPQPKRTSRKYQENVLLITPKIAF
ncbi:MULTISPECIES: hypothetical protein [unclassified Paenibacillus]|uniref:hypothetical protein n=1 Tax=unclassified Paenibacillus TaxID=185978 RepID=UPI00363693F3